MTVLLSDAGGHNGCGRFAEEDLKRDRLTTAMLADITATDGSRRKT